MSTDSPHEIARLRARIQQLENDAAEAKRATEALATTTARTEAILEAAVDAIITTDESGAIESVNAAVGQLFGYEPTELIGHNVKMLMPSPYREGHDGYLEHYRRTGDRRIIGIGREVAGLHRDGTEFPVELSVSEGHDGSRRFFTAILRDISDRREAESERQESAQRLREIVDSAIDGILSIDETGRIQSANPAALRLFRYEEHELLGHNVSMLMPTPHAEAHDGYLQNYLATGMKRIIGSGREVTALRKDGALFPISLTVSEGKVHHQRIFTGIVKDLSAQEKARETQANLAAILDESLNEIFIFDAATLRFIQVNRGARENLGYSISELQDITPVDIKPEISAEEFEAILAPLRNDQKQRLRFETVHQRKDGSTYPVEVHLQLGAYAGSPAFVALIFDLTERREALDTIERSEKRAHQAEKLASIGVLTAGIAHDIGTPMTVILGYAQMMEQAAENEKQRKRARMIAEQTQRVTELVQTLLDLARPGEPKRVDVDLAERLDQALEFFREKLRVRGITVERHFADVPSVLGDPNRIEQVFLNLVVNAADAMPDGGRLTVSVEADEAGQHVLVHLRDTGSGIAPEALERVFEPFYTTKERGEGTGLGLLVSQGIIVEHGGDITVDSEVNVGTEFHIKLPCAALSAESQ